MEFTSLRYFFETAKTGSIRQAAEHIHVAPSAVSRQIAKLEHELGTDLFERRSSGVKLTPAGELLAQQLQSTVRDLMRVRNQIDELKGLRRGEIAIYCIEGLIESFLPRVMTNFYQRYPEIEFSIVVGSTDRIVDAVVCDDADIGISLNAPPRSELTICGGWEEPLHVFVAPGHPLSGRHAITLKELAAYPAALPDRSFGVRRLIDRMWHSVGLEPKVLVTTNSILTTTCIARQGIAYTLMPPFAVERDHIARTLLSIPLTNRGLEPARVEICVHRNRRLPLAAKEFLSWLNRSLPGTSQAQSSKEKSAAVSHTNMNL
jgi:DNA-binding transcriptional LysR family regulator